MNPNITWVSANALIEHQTRRIAQEFCSSKPKPRNKAMGFKGTDKPRSKPCESARKKLMGE